MNRLLLRATNSSVVVHPGYFRLDMSIIQRLIGHGRALLRYHFEGIYNKSPNLGKVDPINVNFGRAGVSQVLPQRAPPPPPPPPPSSPGGTLEWIGQGIHTQVRRFFVDNILRRVTSSLSSGLQQRASQQLLYANNSRPFFALLGVSLASGSGLLTKENEFEGICWEIRESLEKKQRRVANLTTSASTDAPTYPVSVQNLDFGPLIAQGSSAAVYSARWKDFGGSEVVTRDDAYPLGVKMMFNFYCESNSGMILRAMCKEIVPARNIEQLGGIGSSELDRLNRCPPHPNIIEISHVFTDQVPLLSESLDKFPDALPRRLNESGLGRNMSLFLVMKRYDTNLQEYLHAHGDLKLRCRILLLTQLLEGLAHLSSNEIAHRDLKGDNILLSTSNNNGDDYPHLVITDFGCCLADKTHGLHLPFPSVETDRGGNAALMAPEVAGAQPGSWKKISYEKSDVWSAGAIAYEIFGEENPFINRRNRGVDNKPALDSRKYDESELPVIGTVPPLINSLVHNLLKMKPSERLSAEMAATVCQIYLWAPSRWFFVMDTQRISDSEIMQWLLTLTTKLLCQMPGEAVKLEFTLIRTFLRRIRFTVVRHALEWIHGHTTAVPAK